MSDPKSLKNKPTGVKTLNKTPVIAVVTIVSIVLGSLIYAISQRGIKNQVEEKKTVLIQETDPTKQIKAWEDITKNMPTYEAPKTDNKPVVVEKKVDQAAVEREKRRLQRELEAFNSPTKVRVNMPTETAKNKYNMNIPKSTLPAIVAPTAFNQKELTITEKNEKFMEDAKKSFDYLPYVKTDLLSEFEVKTGTLIPAVMISGINSELPGPVIGQVRENVYDTATGNYLLIPQGAKLIGKYNSDVSFGQTRALVAWQRIVFPGGKTLNIESMDGLDQAGYAGFEDQVDNHYFKLFGSAFLISIISGEFSFSTGSTSVNQQSGLGDGTTVSQTAEKVIEKNLSVAPTIKIRPGYKFNIFVQKDMILEALQ